MGRLHSIKVYTVALIFLVFVATPVPVDSILYKVRFEPTKMLTPCKNTNYHLLKEYVDVSKLNISVSPDNELLVLGTVSRIKEIPDAIMSVCRKK